MLAMRAWVLAMALRVFVRFLLPFFRLDLARSNRLSFFRACFKARGLANVVPSESVASVLIPRSTPIAEVAVDGVASCSASTWIETNQRPAFSETVALSILASVGYIRVHEDGSVPDVAIARSPERHE